MSDLAAAVNAAFAYANEPADYATLVGPPSAAFRLPAVRGVLEFAQTVETPEELNEVLRRVSPTVGVPDPFKAAIMALVCGTLIEWGADPAELAPLLLARLPGLLALAQTVSGEETEDRAVYATTHPQGFAAWQALSLMLLPTMAVLARGMEFREQARANADLVAGIEALRERNREADFVAQTLSFTDGMELVVLHPGEGKGFRVELEAVHTLAHLFTLLQGELIGGEHLAGPPPDPEVMALATGEKAPESLLRDEARFHFYPWNAMGADGTLDPILGLFLGVEALPQDIPEFEGERILILGPPAFAGRSWDSNFFANIHDSLRSAARVIEVLTPEEVQRRLERIRARGGDVATEEMSD